MKTEKEYFSYLKQKYKFPRSLIHKEIIKNINEIVQEFPKNSKILDAGCGAGNDSERFQKNHDVYGVDYQEHYIQYCKNKYNSTNYFHSQLSKIPTEDNFFDIIIFNQVIEHIKDIQPIMTELNRVLKPDGKIIICTPNYKSILWNLVEKIYYKYLSKAFDPKTHVVHYTSNNILEGIKPFLPIENRKIFYNSLLFVVAKKSKNISR